MERENRWRNPPPSWPVCVRWDAVNFPDFESWYDAAPEAKEMRRRYGEMSDCGHGFMILGGEAVSDQWDPDGDVPAEAHVGKLTEDTFQYGRGYLEGAIEQHGV